MNAILTQKAPEPIGPYSQAIAAGQMIFCSGQIPLIPGEKSLSIEGIREQTVQALENLREVLSAGHSSFSQVVKTTIYLTDMNHFPACNEVYESYFSAPFPARSCVGVAALPKGALIEIEAIAIQQS
mgnify:CR=1 FL=1